MSATPSRLEFLKHTDTRMHVNAELSSICGTIKLLNVEFAQKALFIFLAQFDKFFSAHNSAQNVIKLNSDSAKKKHF